MDEWFVHTTTCLAIRLVWKARDCAAHIARAACRVECPRSRMRGRANRNNCVKLPAVVKASGGLDERHYAKGSRMENPNCADGKKEQPWVSEVIGVGGLTEGPVLGGLAGPLFKSQAR